MRNLNQRKANMKNETEKLIVKNETNTTWKNLFNRAIANGKDQDEAAAYASEMENHLADEGMDRDIEDQQ